MYIDWSKGTKTLGDKLLMSTEALITLTFVASFKQIALNSDFFTHFLMLFHMYVAAGKGQTALCGQNPDVNRKALSLCPFVASFKKNIFEVWFYI